MDKYGPGLDWSGLEEFKRTAWHRILHMFEVPFYYIEYGIAQLGALRVWLNYRHDPARRARAYKAALTLGGSRPLPELFAQVGAEFRFGPEVIRELMAEVEKITPRSQIDS